jgi:hypothetical protein
LEWQRALLDSVQSLAVSRVFNSAGSRAAAAASR